jgi:septum site-determining protein MinD
MSKILVITSGKGGVGKTTTAINLSAAMNAFNEDVLVIDGNLTTPNLGLHLGSPEVPITLNHVLSKKADPFEAVYEHESGIKIMPSSLSLSELKKIKPEKLKLYKNDFKKIADYIIMDSAAGLGLEARSALESADEIIVVTNPEMPAITDALKTVKLAEQMRKPIKGVIVTRVRRNNSEMEAENVKEMLEIPILGMIPEDSAIQEALSDKDAIVHTHPNSNASRAYKEIAAKILGVDYEHEPEKKPGFWKRLFGRKD